MLANRNTGFEQRHGLSEHEGRPGQIIEFGVGFNFVAQIIGFPVAGLRQLPQLQGQLPIDALASWNPLGRLVAESKIDLQAAK